MENTKRLIFIYNPVASTRVVNGMLSDIIQIFSNSGYETTVMPTRKQGDATEYAVRFCEEKYDRIVVAGGDGTLDEVVSGLMRVPGRKRIPVGYIPTGTTNDFASSLGISSDPIQAAKDITTGFEFKCDIGEFNGESFVYVAAFGLFTDVSYDTNQNLKNALGHAAYVLSAVTKLSQIESYRFTVTTEKHTIEDDFIYGSITNAKSIGGFRNFIKHRLVKFDDGKFEVTLIRMPKNIIELHEIVQSLLFNKRSSKITNFTAKDIYFKTDNASPWTLDGEYGGKYEQVEIHNKCKEITFIIPNIE